MREFKFIRGKYTNENVFNSDETTACLFAYDSEGNLVQFTEKNNKEFQDKFVRLSSDRLSEIYTFRPSQFSISAQKESAGHYSYNFEANEKVYDGSTQFPTDVITNAEKLIKARTEAVFNTTSGLPTVNLEGNAVTTPMTFTFNREKSFTRNLVFKALGFLKERGYVIAQGVNITAYPKSGDIIDFGGTTGTNAKNGTFYQGKLQTAAPTRDATIISDTETISAKGTLPLAKNYLAGKGYRFIKDGKFETDILYQDRLSFTLYKEVSGYLTPASASDATTSTKTFAKAGDKYRLNGADYVYDSSANANQDTTYYLIQSGSSDSGIKLRYASSSPRTYSVISGNDYYFVDSTTPNSFSSLGFKNVSDYTGIKTGATVTSLQEKKSVGAGKVAFIKANGSNNWQPVNSTDEITSKLFATISNKKVYLDKISKDDSDLFTLTYNVTAKYSVTREKFLNVVGIEYYYGNTLLDEYCAFTATAKSHTKFINFNSLDKIIKNNGTVDGTDYGNISTPVKAAINTKYSLNTNYVAYDENESLTELIDENKNKAYERNKTKEATIGSSLKEYNFYYVNSGKAYMSQGNCTVGTRANNQFVEGYAASYTNYYILKNTGLINISEEDLTGKATITYYESNSHHVIDGNAYDNDSTDNANYVMFSDNNWSDKVAITKDNASVNSEGIVSPTITSSTFRLIEGEIRVTATQSD